MKLIKHLKRVLGRKASPVHKAPVKSTRAVKSAKKSAHKTVKRAQRKTARPLKKHSPPKRKLQKVAHIKPAARKKPSKRHPAVVKHGRGAKSRPVQKPKLKAKMDLLAQALAQPEPPEKKVIKPYPILPGGQSARATMLIPLLRELVKRGVISDWLIDVQYNRNANVYLERNFVVEDELIAQREDVLLTIYERFPDGTIGEAQLPIITNDPSVARQEIMDTKQICQYARKKAFDLPQPAEGIMFPQSYDERMLQAAFSGNGLDAPRSIAQQIKVALSTVADVKANSVEVLSSASTIRVINSNGIDVSYHKTSIYLEAVLSTKTKVSEGEFILTRIAVSPEQLDIKSLMVQQAQIAKDATIAQPNPGFTGDVLISGQSVTDVFAPHHDLNPLVLHTSAKLETMGLSSLRFNQPIGHFTGEPITIASNPQLPLGLFSAPVDEEGTPLRPVELIRNGSFVNHIATARYAQYLDVPTTGNLSNIQISPGATREQHLRGNSYIEVVAFSWFNPNPFSGDFSAEIRLAYRWLNGRKTPLRGGTLVGNVFKDILSARFSKETMQSGQYYGPRAILFKNAQVTKFE